MRTLFALFLLSMSHLTSAVASADPWRDDTTPLARVHSPFEFGVIIDPNLLSPPAPSAACILDTCAQKLASIHPRDSKATQKYLAVMEDLTKAYHQEGLEEAVATKLARLCARTLLDIVKNIHVSYPLTLENRSLDREELTRYATHFALKCDDSALIARAYTALALNTPKSQIVFTNGTFTKAQLLYWSYKMIPESDPTHQAHVLLKLLKFWKNDFLPIDGAVQSRQKFVEKLFATSLSPLVSQKFAQSIHFTMYVLWKQTKPFCVFGVEVERHTLEESAKHILHKLRQGQGIKRTDASSHIYPAPAVRLYPPCLQGVDSMSDLLNRALPAGTTLTHGDHSLFYYPIFQ